ncbi:MAG: gamma-glutamyltransferase [Candidatus Rokubacteria bacterium 13_1_40CM_69_27]|nr:MAG: gamma-glutamyltransferase [Candidatus Rokubacteria bacterium 13_1_40CM_69_27]OLC31228.1 MAG: gamma-glutamyltransferase [Candidatus Rokubacteria bacterium 13_1_40CM_4_69_5]
MIRRPPPYAPSGVALAFVLALVIAAPSWGDRPQETPGVPPGTQLPGTAQAPADAGPPSWTGKAFREGVVAVSHPLAAEAGARILENGGNAIDAAAAVQFALNVVEPQFSGIGGGGFMMIHLAKTNETFAVESREKAPAAATPDMFVATGSDFTGASTSGISVGLPGTLLGVATALRNWGTISLGQALAPAITLAEQGFAINRFLAADSASFRTTLQPETHALFRRPDGTPLQEGDLLVQPDLARTFRLIAAQGPDVFYRGEISHAIVAAQQRTQIGPTGVGRMTLADLDQYNVKIRQPITGDYRGFTLASMSPPSSGALTIIQMLKMLERFPLGDATQGFGFGGTRTLHVMIEAMRLAFADRAVWMGDEDFVHVPKIGLLAKPYVDSRAAKISLASRMATPAAGNPLPFDAARGPRRLMLAAALTEHPGHTTHFAIVDKWGNIVSYTTTIEQGWGTGIMVPGYGFLLNNELTDFNFVPNVATGNPGANDVAPFKRPRSSMSPSILLRNGTPIAAYGSPGGATIINSVLNITLDLIDHGMTIQQAIDAPRISVTSAGGFVSREAGFSDAAIAGLQALGHSVGSPAPIGSVQAVVIDLQTGKQYGGADSRREGTVIGLPRPRN